MATGGDAGDRLAAQAAVWSGISLSVVAYTGLHVALPALADDLGLPAGEAVTAVTVFQVAQVSTVLPVASQAGRWGFRRCFVLASLLVAAASALCFAAPSFAWLLAGRALQGLASAALMAVNPALLRLCADPSRLGRAVGRNALVVALAGTAGPVLASAVLSVSGWRTLFLLQVPWALSAAALGWWLLPREQPPQARGRLPFDLLRIATVRRAAAGAACIFCAQALASVALPFALLGAGRSIGDVGVLLALWPLAILAAAPAAGRLSDDGGQQLCFAGAAVLAAALALLAVAAPGNAPWPLLALLLLAAGAGFGFFQTPNNRTYLSDVPADRSGDAGGLQAIARLGGQAAGVFVAGLCLHAADAGAGAAVALGTAALCAGLAARLGRRRPHD